MRCDALLVGGMDVEFVVEPAKLRNRNAHSNAEN